MCLWALLKSSKVLFTPIKPNSNDIGAKGLELIIDFMSQHNVATSSNKWDPQMAMRPNHFGATIDEPKLRMVLPVTF